MKISDILSRKRSFSFEVFPPKPGMPLQPLLPVVHELSLLQPDFISVTHGAGGSGGTYTADGASYVQKEGVPALVHLTCVSGGRALIREALSRLRTLGIENILALRGDGLPSRDFRFASDLIAGIKAEGGFCIGAACYPEGHPESASPEEDWATLKIKAENGAGFFTTQMFFDNTLFFRFLDGLHARKIHTPVLAGIMPLTSAAQMDKIGALSGARMPAELLNILNRYTGTDLFQAGTDYAARQINGLIQNGVQGIHLYTMNKPATAQAVWSKIGAPHGS